MGIALVQTVNTEVSTNPQDCTISPSASGSLLVVMFMMRHDTGNVVSITDNQGNSYVQVPNALAVSVGSDIYTDIWYTANAAAGVTDVTAQFLHAGDGNIEVTEYSGAATSSPVDTAGHVVDETGADPYSGPSITITNPNDVLVTCLMGQLDEPGDVNAPWTDLDEGCAEYIAPGSIGAYQANFSGGSDNFVSSAAAFLPFSAAPGNAIKVFGCAGLTSQA